MAHSDRLLAALLAAVVGASLPTGARAADAPAPQALVVCADPDNLPYSNEAKQGFENRIANVLAADLHMDLQYFWFAEHRGFIRRTLGDGMCDVIMTVPASLSMVATTRPYFTSTYVAVTRTKAARRFTSFDDAWLRDARIGLQRVGSEGATTPPAMALFHRGIDAHITTFAMWAAESGASPQGRIIDAVADGSIDVALVWGPFGGYFAKAHGSDLRIEPVNADPQHADLSFVFPMAVGVRKTDTALRDRLQAALDRHKADIATILQDFHIPTVPEAAATVLSATGVSASSTR